MYALLTLDVAADAVARQFAYPADHEVVECASPRTGRPTRRRPVLAVAAERAHEMMLRATWSPVR